MHHTAHLGWWKEDAFADALYAQKTVASTIGADRALDNRTRSE
jgi:hypothetical protein